MRKNKVRKAIHQNVNSSNLGDRMADDVLFCISELSRFSSINIRNLCNEGKKLFSKKSGLTSQTLITVQSYPGAEITFLTLSSLSSLSP